MRRLGAARHASVADHGLDLGAGEQGAGVPTEGRSRCTAADAGHGQARTSDDQAGRRKSDQQGVPSGTVAARSVHLRLIDWPSSRLVGPARRFLRAGLLAR
jgi:hypothetical protein